MSLGRHLFNFKAPTVYQLEHLDIVIRDKVLLLLSWKFRHSYLLSIPGLKKKYRQRESAVVLKIPSHMDVISINVSSIWRKRKYKVILKKLTLDKETSQFIIQQFKPLKMPDLKLPEINMKIQGIATQVPIPFIKKFNLSLRQKNIQLHTKEFIYPT